MSLAFIYALIQYLPVFNDHTTLFDKIASHALSKLGTFNPQEYFNMVWDM